MKVLTSKKPLPRWGDGTQLFGRSRGLGEREAELAVLIFVDEVLSRKMTLKQFLTEEVFPCTQVEILPHEIKLIAILLFVRPFSDNFVELLSSRNLLGYTASEVDEIVKLATSPKTNGLAIKRALGYT